jgi:hypothetical protein
MNATQVFHYITAITFGASILHTFLPPWDFLDDFPTAQKYYKAFVYFVGFVAENARSTVPYNKGISINNPNGFNTTGQTTSTVSIPAEVTTMTEVKPPEGK